MCNWKMYISEAIKKLEALRNVDVVIKITWPKCCQLKAWNKRETGSRENKDGVACVGWTTEHNQSTNGIRNASMQNKRLGKT